MYHGVRFRPMCNLDSIETRLTNLGNPFCLFYLFIFDFVFLFDILNAACFPCCCSCGITTTKLHDVCVMGGPTNIDDGNIREASSMKSQAAAVYSALTVSFSLNCSWRLANWSCAKGSCNCQFSIQLLPATPQCHLSARGLFRCTSA